MKVISKFTKITLLIGLFWGIHNKGFTQQVTAVLSQDTIQIGDPVSYQLTISPKVDVIKVIWETDSIPSLVQRSTANGSEDYLADFEILNVGDWNFPANKNLVVEKNELKWTEANGNLTNTLNFTIWNEGIYFLPRLEVIVNYRGTEVRKYARKIPLVVTSPLVNEQNPQDSVALSDIKPIIEEPINLEDYIPLMIAGFLLIHLICLLYFLITNKKHEEILPIPVLQVLLPTYTEEKLDRVAAAKFWQQGQIKEYLSSLTFVLREYIENRFNIPALESTTTQILEKIKTAKLSAEQRNQLKEMLEISDLVKFAKAKPAADFLDNALTNTRKFVKETKVAHQQIWVERENYKTLKSGGDMAIAVITQNMRITQDLEALTNPKRLIYAGFWERLGARLLDLLFLGMITSIFSFVLNLVQSNAGTAIWSLDYLLPTAGFFVAITWFYRAYMESKKGGTFGKLILNLTVTDLEGNTISMKQSSIRWLGKLLSEFLLFIGNFWYYFNKNRKQTLYDTISKTIVIKK